MAPRRDRVMRCGVWVDARTLLPWRGDMGEITPEMEEAGAEELYRFYPGSSDLRYVARATCEAMSRARDMPAGDGRESSDRDGQSS